MLLINQDLIFYKIFRDKVVLTIHHYNNINLIKLTLLKYLKIIMRK